MGQLGRTQKSQAASEKKLKAYARELEQKLEARTRELSEAQEQQTATSEILGVIAASPRNIQPVLEAVAESACRLCEAYDSVIRLCEGNWFRVRAHHGPIPVDFVGSPIGRGWVTGRAFVDREPVHVHDLQAAADEFPDGSAYARHHGHRTILAVPLLRENEAIGGQADCTVDNFRTPGGDRDRERAAVRRGAGAFARAFPVGRRAARAKRGLASSELDARSRNRALDDRRQGGAAVRYRGRRHLWLRRTHTRISPARHPRHDRGDDQCASSAAYRLERAAGCTGAGAAGADPIRGFEGTSRHSCDRDHP